jgi:hypothetical protein
VGERLGDPRVDQIERRARHAPTLIES